LNATKKAPRANVKEEHGKAVLVHILVDKQINRRLVQPKLRAPTNGTYLGHTLVDKQVGPANLEHRPMGHAT
jgi:hypothetical protein